jgi:hypothetical protein
MLTEWLPGTGLVLLRSGGCPRKDRLLGITVDYPAWGVAQEGMAGRAYHRQLPCLDVLLRKNEVTRLTRLVKGTWQQGA